MVRRHRRDPASADGVRATSLAELGPRICIMGPSNSGKSTLATAIGQARGVTPIHLDRLYHRPNTDWEPRPGDDFLALHDAALADARWVIDGNYSRCMPQRLARATGLILLDASTALSLLRYLRRSWFERDRLGGLDGGRDSVKWAMIRHIAVTARRNRRRDAAMFDRIGLPKIRLATRRDIARFYRAEGLAGILLESSLRRDTARAPDVVTGEDPPTVSPP